MHNSQSSNILSVSLIFLVLLFSVKTIAGTVTDYGQLQVQGNQIISSTTGKQVQLKGYSSHGLQWFPYVIGSGGTVENMVKDFNIEVIRLAMYVYEWDIGRQNYAGYLGIHNNIYEEQVRPLIQDAIDNDIYVIVDWHLHWNNPTTDNAYWTPDPYTSEAKTFFTMVAEEFGNHPNIIYEVMNEPGTDISWQQIKDHSLSVYNEIRTIDNDNIILVPSPNWSQSILQASQDPLIDVENVAYTMHFYAQSHNFRTDADSALANGIAIWVSEWGMSDYTGDGAIDISENGSSDLWVDWMRDRGISWTAWNFANKGESSSALQAYTEDNGVNESMWATNELLDDVAMQSGPWPDSVIKDSGKWIRTRINEGKDILCTLDCPSDDAIEAENFIDMYGVEVEVSLDTSGGENVGYIDPSDWMKYSVNITSTGSYMVTYRVASLDGGSFKLQAADTDIVYGRIDVPATEGWQNWQTVSHTVNLTAGQQDIVLTSLNGAWNINWFEISLSEPIQDSDNDGVADELDTCPDTPVGSGVDASGCVIDVELDSDNDGVVDDLDSCPDTPAGSDVDASGCVIDVELDSDNDGVVDDLDSCPDTPAGSYVDASGCVSSTGSCTNINVYPNWTTKDWDGGETTHNESGDLMVLEGNAYSANWYTNSLPGSDASWTFIQSCN